MPKIITRNRITDSYRIARKERAKERTLKLRKLRIDKERTHTIFNMMGTN